MGVFFFINFGIFNKKRGKIPKKLKKTKNFVLTNCEFVAIMRMRRYDIAVRKRGIMKDENKNTEVQKLISCVRKGEQSAFIELLGLYNPLVQSEVARHGEALGDFDLDDLRQTALVALYRAALNFDLAQEEVAFGLYAKICISNALATHLRALRRRTVEVPVGDDWDEVQSGDESDPAGRIMAEENLQLLRTRIRALLSPFENCVWDLFTAGFSVGEIAVRLQKESRSIENAIYRIRQKLRGSLNRDGE